MKSWMVWGVRLNGETRTRPPPNVFAVQGNRTVTKHGSAGSELSSQQGGSSEEWNVAECLRILFLRKATLLWITGMAGIGGAPITPRQNPPYPARASLPNY